MAAAAPGDLAAALGFSLFRLAARPDPRPLMLILTPRWMREHGRPCARGLGLCPSRLLLVAPDREAEALWALEEALKSGAVAGALAGASAVPFVVTRRLEFAARAGGAMGLVLREKPSPELSAARLRWRISTLPSARDALDPAAPGLPRWQAELVRRRDGPPATFVAEREEGDEAHRLRLAAGLAGDGLAQARRSHAAA